MMEEVNGSGTNCMRQCARSIERDEDVDALAVAAATTHQAGNDQGAPRPLQTAAVEEILGWNNG